jgi:hypothetical protein
MDIRRAAPADLRANLKLILVALSLESQRQSRVPHQPHQVEDIATRTRAPCKVELVQWERAGGQAGIFERERRNRRKQMPESGREVAVITTRLAVGGMDLRIKIYLS